MKPFATALLALAATATATAAFAQAPAGRVLTKDELRSCLTTSPQLAEREKALAGRVPAIQAQLEAVKKESEALQEERKGIKEDDMRMQIRFENKRKEFNTRVEASNKAAETFQADRAAFDKDLNAYNGSCTGVSFKNEDKVEIEKELAAAKK